MRLETRGIRFHPRLERGLRSRRFGRLFIFGVVILIFLGAVLLTVFILSSLFFFQDRDGEGGKRDGFSSGVRSPVEVKGVYVHAYSAAGPRMEETLRLLEETELNAMIIDLKDFDGYIPFDTRISLADEIGSERIIIQDMKGLIERLHERQVYVIARIPVFQDSALATKIPEIALKDKRRGGLWQGYNGARWVDPASKEAWQYNVDLAKEAERLGFDEINFDYIRFPSDGPIGDMVFPIWDGRNEKHEVIRSFFEFISRELRPNPLRKTVLLSIDLFGLTMIKRDDLNIGQVLEDAIPYFDYISPMVYPSHYPPYFQRFENPAEHPYEVVSFSLNAAKTRLAGTMVKLRPWLQDFDLGADYTPEMVRSEIQAAEDSGSFGWMLWNIENIYTRDALRGVNRE